MDDFVYAISEIIQVVESPNIEFNSCFKIEELSPLQSLQNTLTEYFEKLTASVQVISNLTNSKHNFYLDWKSK